MLTNDFYPVWFSDQVNQVRFCDDSFLNHPNEHPKTCMELYYESYALQI